MKTAVILFGSPGPELDLNLFMASCTGKVIAKGYTIIHPTTWNEYKSIDMREFITKTSRSIDAYFLFVDMGVSEIMRDVVLNNYYRDDDGFSFAREIKVEIGYDSNMFTLNYFLREVSDVMKIPIERMKTKTRKREVVVARQFYFVRAKLYTTESLAAIGGEVGKDHATVIHGIKTVNNTPSVLQEYQEKFEGKKKIKKEFTPIRKKDLKPVRSEAKQVSDETKSMLIGNNPGGAKIINMESPFKSLNSAEIRPFSGYRVHSL